MFKCSFLNENVWIPIEISLKFVPKGSINNNPALFQIMAWRRPGDKPLSEPMMVSSLTHICVTRPQWVKIQQGLDTTRFSVCDCEIAVQSDKRRDNTVADKPAKLQSDTLILRGYLTTLRLYWLLQWDVVSGIQNSPIFMRYLPVRFLSMPRLKSPTKSLYLSSHCLSINE